MKNTKRVKRITVRVTEETYQRWSEAARGDERTLSVWIQRRIDGKPAQEPAPELPHVDTPRTESVVESPPRRGLLAGGGLLAHVKGS